MTDCTETFKRISMKLRNSERLDRAREQMRQKARDLRKKRASLVEKASANPTLQKLRNKMKRHEEEEEKKNNGPSQEEEDFNSRMYYDFMKAQKELIRREELANEKEQARLGKLKMNRAAQLGNNEAVERLLDMGEGNKPEVTTGFTPLHEAANRGKLETCKLLLTEGRADLNARDRFGCTPLCRAAASGHLRVVRWLIESAVGEGGVRADENICSHWHATPLHFASAGGHLDICHYLLLQRNADILAQTHSLKTPYEVICQNCSLVVRSGRGSDMRNMLHKYVKLAQNEIVAALGTNLDGVDKDEAVLTHRIGIAKRLDSLHQEWLDSLDTDLKEDEKKTATLFQATKDGRCIFLDDLLSDPGHRDLATEIRDESYGRSLLHIAAKSGNCALAELLFDSTYLDPLDPDGKGRTCLHLASLYGHTEMVSLLLENAQPPGPEGWSMLTSAKDDNGKRASDLLCQRWKPSLAPGVAMPPPGVVRAEKIRVRTELEYILDPERAAREEAQLAQLETFENQVSLSKFYHESGLKAPKWIRKNSNEINSKLGDARALKRTLERRLKQKREFEKKRREREKYRRAELMSLSKNATKSRKKLKKLLHEIEFKQAKKIGWSESRLKELRPKISTARNFVNQEEAFMNTVHPRVASVAREKILSTLTEQSHQLEAYEVEESVEENKVKETQDDWLDMDNVAKQKVVSTAEHEQLDIRLEAARNRYEDQIKLKTLAMIQLEAAMVPEQAVLDKMIRQSKTGEKIDWKLTRRRGKNFMNAGKTVKVALTERERAEAEVTAEEIRVQLAKDKRRLAFGKKAVEDKKTAWRMWNGKLWFEFARDHVGREIQRSKRNLHRKCKVEIENIETKLQAATDKIQAISTKLNVERHIKTEHLDTLCAKFGCLRWWRRAAIALIRNLEEDLENAIECEASLRKQLDEAKYSEINSLHALSRQEEEAVKMLHEDVGSEILDNKIPDAIELPFVSDSDSSEGSDADSGQDRIDLSYESDLEIEYNPQSSDQSSELSS